MSWTSPGYVLGMAKCHNHTDSVLSRQLNSSLWWHLFALNPPYMKHHPKILIFSLFGAFLNSSDLHRADKHIKKYITTKWFFLHLRIRNLVDLEDMCWTFPMSYPTLQWNILGNLSQTIKRPCVNWDFFWVQSRLSYRYSLKLTIWSRLRLIQGKW